MTRRSRPTFASTAGALALAMTISAAAHAEPAKTPAWKSPALVKQTVAARSEAAREAVARRRARLLLAAMTLDQKLQQLTGARPEVLSDLPGCFGGRHVSGIAALGIPGFRITNGPVGLGQNDCVSLEVGKAPARDMGFGPIQIGAYTHPSSAKATALPSAVAAAASFDPQIAALYGTVISTEMQNLGLHVFEAPGVNLARLPILGRNFEYFGEDPFLSGTMAVAEVRSIQSHGLIAMPKHYAANEQETNRMLVQTSVDRQTLRELYLLPFEMAVKDGKAASVMCAYNYVNGRSSCENRELLTDVLRTDWGFTGYVQSDFFAMKSTVPTLAAGMDHEMPVPLHWAPDKLKAALASGDVKLAQIDQALERRYTQAIRLGIFDRKVEMSPIDFAAGGRKAREIGARGAVLLQNNGALPLAAGVRSLVLIGKASQPYAQQAVAGGALTGQPMGSGGGSSDVVPGYTVSPIEGLRQAVGAGASVKLILVDDANTSATIDGQPATFAEAVAAAQSADAVVMMAGTIAEEGADRASFTDTTGHQLASSAALGNGLDWYAGRSNFIATTGDKNTVQNSGTTAMIGAILGAASATDKAMAAKSVLVLKDNAGAALPAALIGAQGPAILEAWFPGQEDGNIVADVLFGKVNPSGKLPVTFAIEGKGFLDSVTPSQFPGVLGADGKTQTVTYSEQLAIGYRWYDANVSGTCAERDGRNPCVAFPFGHGLSYTSFAVGEPGLAQNRATGVWRATARVRNTGARAGAEVVQVYLTLPASADMAGAKQPPKRLVGFQRVELAPGESRMVEIAIDPKASNHPLSVWDERAHAWQTPAGNYTVWIGNSSASASLARAGVITR